MLSKNQVVAVKNAIESTYSGVCNVVEHQKVQRSNKSTGFEDKIVLEKLPCKLSFENVTNANDSQSATLIAQLVKLFISPDIKIKPGSKIVVSQNGVTTEYKNSGEPAIYSTHQEIVLELFKGWS